MADGGVINIAKIWPDRTVLYIDDISLMKSREYWFTIDGIASPIAGNGLVVGPDIAPHLDEDFGTDPPGVSLDKLRQDVKFLTRAEVETWARAHCDEPGIMIKTNNRCEVIATIGEIYIANCLHRRT